MSIDATKELPMTVTSEREELEQQIPPTQRVGEHAAADAFGLGLALPLRRVAPCRLRAANLTPWLMPQFDQRSRNIATGTLRRDLITAQPTILRRLRPCDVSVFHFRFSDGGCSKLVTRQAKFNHGPR